MMHINNFRFGFIAVTGRPNVGKSTLMNHLIGEKAAIISSKPQTTRNQIQGIITGLDYQAAFIDTPGIIEPKSKLDGYMAKSAESALDGADVVLFMTEADAKNIEKDLEIIGRFKKINAPVFLILNKIDKRSKTNLLAVIEKYKSFYNFKEIIPLSALTGENTDRLLNLIRGHLPEGPPYFPEDHYTDQHERQIVSEIIREKALLHLQDEIPHGIAVEILKFKQKDNLVEIEATIYCEKESHKGMIIGKQGVMLKKIGQAARVEIEQLLDTKIFLETWVKVKKNWRNDEFFLKSIGYGKR